MSSVALRSKDLIPFNRYILREGLVLDFDVFTTDSTNQHIRNIRKGVPVSGEVERYASSNSALKLFIHPNDVESFRSLLESIANNAIDSSNSVSGLFRDAAHMQWIRDSFVTALESRDTIAIYDSAMVNSERMMSWFGENASLRSLFEVLETPGNWQTCSINTAMVCTYFAHALGARGNSLMELSLGALTADIGYLDVDPDAFKSFFSPSFEDQRKLDAHPILGLKRVAALERASFIMMMLVYQHHERLDKRGFPVGLPGDLISDAAKMYTVVDRFMANAGNKHPYSSDVIQEAMGKLEGEIGTRISKEHFRCWKLIVQEAL
jgi:HD-GYP domain-containing protein (c-di-GMP phosphodiesterase class II)